MNAVQSEFSPLGFPLTGKGVLVHVWIQGLIIHILISGILTAAPGSSGSGIRACREIPLQAIRSEQNYQRRS